MPNDIDLLQGAWAVSALEVDGRPMPENMISDARVVVEGDRFTSKGMGSIYAGTLKLDSAAKPRSIDMIFDVGPEAGNINRGIYELKGSAWKICIATRGDARPAAFATGPGSGFALETLRRSTGKPAKLKAKAAAASSLTASAPTDTGVPATEFDGEWRMVSGVMNGGAVEESLLQWVKRVNRGNTSTVLAGPQTMLKVEFTTDTSQSPHAIDYVNLAGPNKGKKQLGIYAFDGDLMKICVAAPEDERPSEFLSAPGDKRAFTVWKKG
jgi:uncharacterized protein (TIGR03067 family)